MFETREDAAIAAVLAMLLEVSGTPKVGNVDREHDFTDLKYEHFLSSASSAFPVFLDATQNGRMGELILRAVKNSCKWHRANNVHFGAFILLIPLLKAWNARIAEDAGERATLELRKTTFEDSISFLEAFRISKARVMDVKKLDLRADETKAQIEKNGINLYRWMELAPEENILAKEVVGCFQLSVSNSKLIRETFEITGDLNYSIVLGYHNLLSKVKDPLIVSKFGDRVAEEVRRKAAEILRELLDGEDIKILRRFDEELISRGINPGSVADMTISSIYLALLDGLRF
jgi:triphosphoribosyl-dephospho-CoA synthase